MKIPQPIIAFLALVIFLIAISFREDSTREERLYNADQDRIMECAKTRSIEECHLLINGNCDE